MEDAPCPPNLEGCFVFYIGQNDSYMKTSRTESWSEEFWFKCYHVFGRITAQNLRRHDLFVHSRSRGAKVSGGLVEGSTELEGLW